MRVKLTSLNPRFLSSGGEGISNVDGTPSPRREGVGVELDCPCGCETPLFVPFKNPLDGSGPGPYGDKGWQRTGETFETLTLTPSILRTKPHGCGWHGFITNGEVHE